jgi:hypothetical protein
MMMIQLRIALLRLCLLLVVVIVGALEFVQMLGQLPTKQQSQIRPNSTQNFRSELNHSKFNST